MKARFIKLGLFISGAAILLFVLQWDKSQPEQPDPWRTHPDLHGWDLLQFAQFLDEQGMNLRLISSRQKGVSPKTVSIYLSEDPQADWLTCQRKIYSGHWIDQWKGTVVLRYWEAEIEPFEYEVRLGPFVVFGDPELTAKIKRVFRPTS